MKNRYLKKMVNVCLLLASMGMVNTVFSSEAHVGSMEEIFSEKVGGSRLQLNLSRESQGVRAWIVDDVEPGFRSNEISMKFLLKPILESDSSEAPAVEKCYTAVNVNSLSVVIPGGVGGFKILSVSASSTNPLIPLIGIGVK